MKLVVALALLSNAAAFMAPVQPRAPRRRSRRSRPRSAATSANDCAFKSLHSPGDVPSTRSSACESAAVPSPSTRDDVEHTVTTQAMIEKAKADRLAHLEAQSLEALTLAADNFERAVFPNAMIVGDCVITHLLGKLGYLESGKVKVMVVDTFHLFDSARCRS